MGAVANLVPIAFLAAYVNLGAVSLFAYFAASTLCDGFANSLSSISQAYIADKMAPYNRAGAFSLLMGVMSLALLLGPAVGSSMPSCQWRAGGYDYPRSSLSAKPPRSTPSRPQATPQFPSRLRAGGTPTLPAPPPRESRRAMWTALAGSAVSIPYLVCFLPESLSEARPPLPKPISTARHSTPCSGSANACLRPP